MHGCLHSEKMRDNKDLFQCESEKLEMEGKHIQARQEAHLIVSFL